MSAETIPDQLRRRRAESRRCEVLHDGRRDPHDPPRQQQSTITVRVLGHWTAEAEGPGVVGILDRLGCQRMRSRNGPSMWQFPSRHLEDFVDLAEHRGIRIESTL